MNSSKIKNICIIILSIVLFVYLVLFINSLMNNEKVGFFNIRFYIMPSDEQEMQLNEGDLVIAKTIKPDNLKEDDKVLYRKNDVISVKKIAGINSNDGKVNLVIKENNANENQTIEDAQIIGKVIGNIERVGSTALFIQSPFGTLNVVILMICIFIIIKKIVKKTENDANDN